MSLAAWIQDCSTGAFLQALVDPKRPLLSYRAIPGRVPGNWRTLPRTQSLRQVAHSHYSFCAPHSAMELHYKGRSLDIPAGTLCWCPPGIKFDLFMRSRRESEIIHRLRFCLGDGAQDKLLSCFTDIIRLNNADFVAEYVNRCYAAFASNADDADYRRRCLLGLYTSEVLRRRDDQRGEGTLSSIQIQVLTDYALTRIDQRPAPAELARLLGYAPNYFSRLFRRSIGQSPRSWLKELRITQAAEALRSSRSSINEIALEFGYDNPFLFSRQFQQVMHCSPTIYRSMHQNDPS